MNWKYDVDGGWITVKVWNDQMAMWFSFVLWNNPRENARDIVEDYLNEPAWTPEGYITQLEYWATMSPSEYAKMTDHVSNVHADAKHYGYGD